MKMIWLQVPAPGALDHQSVQASNVSKQLEQIFVFSPADPYRFFLAKA